MSGPEPAGPPLAGRDLRLDLGGRAVLDGVDLSLAPGELVALVGPSGCGKSTLLSILAGLREPDSGEVLVDGRPDPGRLGRITLMPQSDALLSWRTLRDNVRLGADLGGLPAGERDRATRRALARMGLAGFEEHYPHALSGGMRQRAALARTLLGGGRVWLLDEPFGALDALTRADLQGALAHAWAESRPTVLLVTHDVEEAVLLADRVLVSGPRPARVVDEVTVDLPRPRGLADTARPEFGELRGRVLRGLRSAGALV